MKTFVLLLVLSLLAMASVVNAANLPDATNQQDDDDTPVSFTGTWKTIAGGTTRYTVILKQTDNEVIGSYSPGNGKIFDGVVNERKLTFKWSQDGGYEGTAEFTMDQDGKGFTGRSTAIKPKGFTVTWNTDKPPVASFGGNWQTISNGRYSIPLTIVQSGDRVTGVYPGSNGKIEGTVSGKVLRFKWESDGGSGSGRFVMDESGEAFSGTYNSGDNPDNVEATWNGKRPTVADDKGSGTGTPPIATFGGVWKATLGASSITMKFLQSGDQIAMGGYQADVAGAPIFSLKEGTIVGNTLRFKVANADGIVVGKGELVMGQDGKSFKGNIRGIAVTGTFVGPLS